jgi:hypothetical protein
LDLDAMPDGNLSPSATIFTSNLESLSRISAASILASEYGAAKNEHKDTTKRNRCERFEFIELQFYSERLSLIYK